MVDDVEVEEGEGGVGEYCGGRGVEKVNKGRCKKQRGNIQEAVRDQPGKIRGTVREHPVNGQGTSREQSGNIQGTSREHLGNIQGTTSEHPGNTEGTYSEHRAYIHGTCKVPPSRLSFPSTHLPYNPPSSLSLSSLSPPSLYTLQHSTRTT